LRAVLTTDELARLMAKAPSDLTPAATVDEDVMYWGYTSGSTGLPKAAVHSHRDFVAAADLVGVGIFGLGPDDLTFSASKMYFAFGLGNTLYFPQRVGASSLLVPERLDPARIFELIEAERPTVFFAVATVYARLLQIPDAKPRERTRTTMLGEWLRTGDMFSRDEDGYFYLAGRSDDMLKVRGMWVSPIEIEAALVAHPDVIEAAVVGRPDGDGLLKAHAFVVMRPGHALA